MSELRIGPIRRYHSLRDVVAEAKGARRWHDIAVATGSTVASLSALTGRVRSLHALGRRVLTYLAIDAEPVADDLRAELIDQVEDKLASPVEHVLFWEGCMRELDRLIQRGELLKANGRSRTFSLGFALAGAA